MGPLPRSRLVAVNFVSTVSKHNRERSFHTFHPTSYRFADRGSRSRLLQALVLGKQGAM